MAENILVIDDEEDHAFFLATLLERAGYAVRVCRGARAIDRELRGEDAERKPIDLIITDLMMPEMDGLEVMRRAMRLRPLTPIIGVTGGGAPWPLSERWMRALGASHVFTKPLDSGALLAAVTKSLTSRPASFPLPSEERLP